MVGDCQLCKLSDICKYIYAESCPCHLDTVGIYVVDNKDTTYVIKKK